jgi:hypothetical protein
MLEDSDIHFFTDDDILLHSHPDWIIGKHFLLESLVLLEELLDIRIDVALEPGIAVNIFTFGIWRPKTQDNKKSLISFSKASLELIHRPLIKIMSQH